MVERNNRKEAILQALAKMLESEKGANRITTAKLASTVGVSEAALYRHFPSKAHMFDSLITYIEENLQSRINRILQDEKEIINRLRLVMLLLLGFSEKNPGLTRIMTGHALMFEHALLQTRVNQFFERIEMQIRQIMRERKILEGDRFASHERLLAHQLVVFYEGTLVRFVRSAFNQLPTADFDHKWLLLLKQLD